MSPQKPFIVIEGIDGIGKSTQSQMIANRLNSDNHKAGTIHFPTNDTPTGKLINKYLNGEFGDAVEIQPKIASTWYALDRLNYQPLLESLLKLEIIICDRYVGSNIAYQGAKYKDKDLRDEFIDWVYDFEYNISGIKQPDLIILMDADKPAADFESIKTKDNHETNEAFQQDVSLVYSELAQKYNWHVVNCINDGNFRTPLDINDEIYEVVHKSIINHQKYYL